MIHLDTNVLISLVAARAAAYESVEQWIVQGEILAVSALVWSEFLSGPVSDQQIALVEQIVGSRVVPFDSGEAVVAAGLFNRAGRRRGSRVDGFVAATALRAGAALATANQKDFQIFVQFGLRLLEM